MPTFIIEHLEPELYKWCLLEYAHILELVGKQNLWFTNVRKGQEKLSHLGKVFGDSIATMNLKNACVLDPEAEVELKPDEAKQFSYFILGGILGDDPPKERTNIELTKKVLWAAARNLGEEQMSTDTAVAVVQRIISGTPFKDLPFIDSPEVHISEGESVILPYRYLRENDKPVLPPGLVNMLKTQEGF